MENKMSAESNLSFILKIFEWIGIIFTFLILIGTYLMTNNITTSIIATVLWFLFSILASAIIKVLVEISKTLKSIDSKMKKQD